MMIRLTCPSCNGDLELPDNLNVAHCLYCGTKILLDENIKNNSIKQYKEIILTALLAGNNNEVIEYCNKVLEFDSRNVDAWLDKANAIYNGTTETDDKFDEALIYLRKAYSIAPDNQRVFKVSRIIVEKKASWENRLGNNEYNKAMKLLDSFKQKAASEGEGDQEKEKSSAGNEENLTDIKNKSLPIFLDAARYFMKAAYYCPTEIQYKKNALACTQKADWYDWNQFEEINVYQNELEKLELKETAIKKIEIVKNDLRKAINQLDALKSGNSIFKDLQIKYISNRISRLRKQLMIYDVNSKYAIPEFDIEIILKDKVIQ